MNVEPLILMRCAEPSRAEPPGGVGRIIDGRYQLGELLGEGGEGRVYAAQDLVERHRVALKIVASGGPVLGEEFLVARNLVHPNIVRVLDVGRCASGDQYFTMDLLDAGDLRDVFERWGVEGLLRVAVG